MSALATQVLIKANKIDLFGDDEWLGSPPCLNTYENMGAIMNRGVFKIMESTKPVLNLLKHKFWVTWSIAYNCSSFCYIDSIQYWVALENAC